jgi:phosphate-selective porin OprO and OprP
LEEQMSNWTRIVAGALGLGLLMAAPAAAQDDKDKGTSVDLSKGGIRFKSGNNSMNIGARAQFRWTVDDRDEYDADTTGTGVGAADGTASSFDVPRMRVTIGGSIYKPWLKYSFQWELSRTSGESASKIKDAIIRIDTSKNANLQFGQFKAPFGLQQLTSSGRQQFVDRAITDGKFSPGRDMGVMFSGSAAERKIGYAVGVFNGSGESVRQEDEGHMLVGRVFFNPFGGYNTSESALENNDKPVLHIGLAARTGEVMKGTATAGVFEDPNDQTAIGLEFAFKLKQLFATAEFFNMTDEIQNPAAGPDVDSRGFHVQVGYMIVPKTTELGIRYAQVEGNKDVDNAAVNELRAVFGYFWQAHNLKLQADVGQVKYEAGYAGLSSIARRGLPSLGTRLAGAQDYKDNQFRLQLQVSF